MTGHRSVERSMAGQSKDEREIQLTAVLIGRSEQPRRLIGWRRASEGMVADRRGVEPLRAGYCEATQHCFPMIFRVLAT
jgi:hypothetical protein